MLIPVIPQTVGAKPICLCCPEVLAALWAEQVADGGDLKAV